MEGERKRSPAMEEYEETRAHFGSQCLRSVVQAVGAAVSAPLQQELAELRAYNDRWVKMGVLKRDTCSKCHAVVMWAPSVPSFGGLTQAHVLSCDNGCKDKVCTTCGGRFCNECGKWFCIDCVDACERCGLRVCSKHIRAHTIRDGYEFRKCE
jgi:hypothetical protein